MIGQRFGNYRALSLLGEGGMGAVYLAEHPEIGRRVAIKVLRPELIKDPSLLQRFLNEARAANAIRHPNIIEILDSGTTPEGTPYLVMELLEGEVLSARIERVRKMSLGETLELSYQTASALAAAHEKGIIHRDLKPDNLFIIRDPADPARERIKVLDFGIAKLQTMPTGSGMQTRTGTLMGTPVYMSPEQCLGTKLIDQRSDVYALGVIMFEMLSGRPPFVSEGFGELVNMHLNVKARSLREIDPSIPQAVADLVAKALAKSPDGRQRSAAELQLDIRAAAGESIVIRGVSSPDLTAATLPGGRVGVGHLGAPGKADIAGGGRGFSGATTLSTGTGERQAVTVPAPRSSAKGRIAIGAVVLVGVGVAVLAGVRRTREAGPGAAIGTSAAAPAKSVAAEPAVIHVSVESQPPGAIVSEAESGALLGTTPVVVERPASQKTLTIRLEKTGFAPMTRTLTFDRDRTETLSLAEVSAAAKELAAASGKAPPAPPLDKRPVEKSKKAPRPRHVPAPAEEEPAKL